MGHLPAIGVFYRYAHGRHKVGDLTEPDSWALGVITLNNPCYLKTDCCECFGISLFFEFDEIVNARKFVPFAKNKSIAKVELTGVMGRILNTPSKIGDSHFDWWATPLGLVPVAEIIVGKL